MALMEPPVREVVWFGPCILCGSRFCADLEWLASTYGSGAEPPCECPRCDPLGFLEMPFTLQPWHE